MVVMSSKSMKTIAFRSLSLAVGLLLLVTMTTALHAKVVKPVKKGIVLEGYDVVAYFEDKKPVRGSSKFSSKYNKLMYHFKNESHKALFDAMPTAYLPSYGGYCSLGMKYGQKSPVNVSSWRIHKGRLYLMYNSGTAAVWDRDANKNVRIADRVWKQIN